MTQVEKILSYMKTDKTDKTIQRSQTAHRIRLIDKFNIQKGERILEIGCGQGDTTAVLADAVGQNGLVHAVDIAARSYGSPFTLGEATDHIKHSAIGERIIFDFETDILEESFIATYDTVVLSHSLFYFESLHHILTTLKKARKLAKKICLAEWDITPQTPSQMAHSQAIFTQALYNQYVSTDGNIRLFLTKYDVSQLLMESDWTLTPTQFVSARDLLDGSWEVHLTKEILQNLENIPEELKPTFCSFEKWINLLTEQHKVESCDSFVIVAS